MKRFRWILSSLVLVVGLTLVLGGAWLWLSSPAVGVWDAQDYALLTSDVPTNSTAKTPEIPKIIWTYWTSEDIPQLVQEFMATWAKQNPDYKINVLNRQNLNSYISVRIPHNMDSSSIEPQFKADWIRLAVLREHGGFWVDGSFFMGTSLAFIHEKQQKEGTEGFQFYIEKFGNDPNNLYYENWFIATIPRGRLITEWFKEYSICFERFGVTDAYLDYLKAKYGDDMYARFVQNSNAPGYLKQHLSLQKALQIDGVPHPSGISATDQDFGPFSLVEGYDWDAAKLIDKLVSQAWEGPPPNFLKLTGWFRYYMQFYLGHKREFKQYFAEFFTWRTRNSMHPSSFYSKFLKYK